MHRFSRGEAPGVLAGAHRRFHNDWNAFLGSEAHTALGEALFARQHHYCAYCEVALSRKEEGHIEHLQRRSDVPERTFDWSNLFFSCSHLDTCGKYKDNQRIRFNPADIIDPSRENPLDYLRYDMNGNVHAIEGDPVREHRANETIRIFHLNAPRLKGIRKQIAITVQSLFSCDENEQEAFLKNVRKGHYDCVSVYHNLLGKTMPPLNETE